MVAGGRRRRRRRAASAGAGVALWQARARRRAREAARAEEVKSFALSIFESADPMPGAGVATTAIDLLKAAQPRVESELARPPGDRRSS